MSHAFYRDWSFHNSWKFWLPFMVYCSRRDRSFLWLFGAVHLGVSLDWVLLIVALLVLLAVFKDKAANKLDPVS